MTTDVVLDDDSVSRTPRDHPLFLHRHPLLLFLFSSPLPFPRGFAAPQLWSKETRKDDHESY